MAENQSNTTTEPDSTGNIDSTGSVTSEEKIVRDLDANVSKLVTERYVEFLKIIKELDAKLEGVDKKFEDSLRDSLEKAKEDVAEKISELRKSCF